MTNQPPDTSGALGDEAELRKQLCDLFFKAAGGISDMANVEVAEAMQLIQSHTRQLEQRVLEAVGEDENDPNSNARWQTYRNELRTELRTKLKGVFHG